MKHKFGTKVHILYIFILFILYIYINPLGNPIKEFEKNAYTLELLDVNKSNKSSVFRYEDNNAFYIHPGEIKPTRGIFKFEKENTVIFNFSLQSNAKHGKIKFSIVKNGKIINTSLVTSIHQHEFIVPVLNYDEIEIIADKNGSTFYDWGHLTVKIKHDYYLLQNILILLLWLILFIYLANKNYTYSTMGAFTIFMLILYAEKINYGIMTFNILLLYLLLLWSFIFLSIFIYQTLKIFNKLKISFLLNFSILSLIYLIPIIFIIYKLNFNNIIDKNVLYAVFQSNIDESHQFIFDFISIKYLFLFLFLFLFLGFLLYEQSKLKTIKINPPLLIFISILFLSLSYIHILELRIPNIIINNFKIYQKEITLFQQIRYKRKINKINFNTEQKNKKQNEIHVIILGESLNKHHMGIYGYFRNTTPNLTHMHKIDKNLLLFTNTYSSYVTTSNTLSLSLTEANQYNGKKYFKSPSIIEILKAANIETYWITNQSLYGPYDNMVSVIATDSDYLISTNTSIGQQSTSAIYDDILIDKFKKVLLSKNKGTKVIFIHLMGSHGRYDTRFPKNNTYLKYKKNKMPLGEAGIYAYKNSLLNNYDNSVLFNDYVVSSILNLLKTAKGANSLIYMSDHSEDVLDKNTHNRSRFTYPMTQIPMIAWFNTNYKNKYPNTYNTLFSNQNTLFSNDMFYDTLIGMFNINTSAYNKKYDLSSTSYLLKHKDALLFHGEKYYTSQDNYFYWQQKNSQYLVDNNLSTQIFPKSINSIAMLHDIWQNGFRTFTINSHFLNPPISTIQIGNIDDKTNISIEELIKSVDYKKIKKIKLTLNNVRKENYNNILQHLEDLNKKYHIKEKIDIELNIYTSFIDKFTNSGWSVSLYVPSMNIHKYSSIIINKINEKNISNISFNYQTYPIIKKYIEPFITKNIYYSVSSNDLLLNQKNFTKKIFLNAKIKEISILYKSKFDIKKLSDINFSK